MTGCQGTPAASSGRPGSGPSYAIVVNGNPVGRSELASALAERAGAEIVREYVLERALKAELERQGINITESLIEDERRRFVGALDEPTPGVLERVARRRGLGPTRLPAFLWRNAALRALAAPEPVSDAEVARAIDIRYGEGIRARVILTATERDAVIARARAVSDPAGPSAGMAAAAFEYSIDPSAAVGGLFENTSASDPRWPRTIAEQFGALGPGEVSPVIGLADAAAVVLVEERTPATEPPLGADAQVRASLKRDRERAAMAELADVLIRRADVSVLDRSLAWSMGNANVR